MHSVPKAPPLKRTLQKRKYHGAIRTHVWRALIDNLLLKSRSIKCEEKIFPARREAPPPLAVFIPHPIPPQGREAQ